MEILLKVTVSAKFRAIRPKLCGYCTFPQNFHTRKLVEISVILCSEWCFCNFSWLKIFEKLYIILIKDLKWRLQMKLIKQIIEKILKILRRSLTSAYNQYTSLILEFLKKYYNKNTRKSYLQRVTSWEIVLFQEK